MANKLEDINTFNITIKTSNEIYSYIMGWFRGYSEDIEIISDELLPDTNDLYHNDHVFKKMVKDYKQMKNDKLDYILKHNK